MKVYLPQTQRIEDFLSTLEDVTAPGIIKTRSVIEVECEDKSMASFLASIDPSDAAMAKPKKKTTGRPKKSPAVDEPEAEHE